MRGRGIGEHRAGPRSRAGPDVHLARDVVEHVRDREFDRGPASAEGRAVASSRRSVRTRFASICSGDELALRWQPVELGAAKSIDTPSKAEARASDRIIVAFSREPALPTSARMLTRLILRVEESVNLRFPMEDGASIRVRRRAGGRRVPPRRVEPLALIPERHDLRSIANQGEGNGDSKGDVFEPERGTLLPTVKPVRRWPRRARRIQREIRIQRE